LKDNPIQTKGISVIQNPAITPEVKILCLLSKKLKAVQKTMKI
jgi:hypothetical protein